jgi:formylglycine-generating enzyme required for sulfatase activity
MGSADGFAAEQPAHRVWVDAFYISRHLVTNAQYHRFVMETDHAVPHVEDPRAQNENWDPQRRIYPPGRERHPVALVSWYDAQAYCAWAGCRLPTEGEWEKAARGGLQRMLYPWGDDIDPSRANFDNQSGSSPVGSYPPNGYGLYDVSGNLWEWVEDWYDLKYYRISPDANPRGPERGTVKVLRGGAWLLFPEFCRVAYRFRNSPDFRFNLIGFRPARAVLERPRGTDREAPA